jgi:ATP-dependent DNA helicase DinG
MDEQEAIGELRAAVGHLAGGGEARPGQAEMAGAVARSIASGRHLVVQAGTGTGKSLAYLVPAITSGRRVVVATATKALQDQLAGKDLPFLAEHLDRDFSWAVLKGRSNYICLQRVRETTAGADGKLELDDVAPTIRAEIRKLAAWSGTSESGDQAELDWNPSPRAWQAVSVGSDECPGATRCPLGDSCFAEAARRRAAAAEVIVVNTHLYGTHLASGGVVLPEHDVVIFDEAHQLEDTISDTVGVALSPGRFLSLARTVRQVVADEAIAGELAGAGSRLADVAAPYVGQRLPSPLPADLVDALAAARARVDVALQALRRIETELSEANQRKIRAQKAATSVVDDIDKVLAVPDGSIAWVEGPAHNAYVTVSPIDVGPVLKQGVWSVRTAVLTSATLAPGLPERVGLPAGRVDVLDVGSPFDYEENALLYCARHLPDPRRPEYAPAMHDELVQLITAAGGRTLALFTSWRAMEAAVAAVGPRLPYRVLTQADLPKPALVRAFADDEESCLFATVGLFQGIDVPGRALGLVTIDKLPFPRPDEPLLQARRDLAGAAAFSAVDLPRASTLLAQAAGRLIRTATDRGVVAVFDRRLATAGYRWDIVRAMPPMRRTRHLADAVAFLASEATP